MKKSKLSKKNWTQLNEFGLVAGRNNGFASTTPKAEKIGFSSEEKFLKLEGNSTVYAVSFYDDCIYPFWYVVNSFSESPAKIIKIKKLGEDAKGMR